MKPAIKPGLLAVWRNRDTVQIGIDPRRAIALTGMRGAAVLLGLLDGSRDLAQVLATAGELGISAEAVSRTTSRLARRGVIAFPDRHRVRILNAAELDRLATMM